MTDKRKTYLTEMGIELWQYRGERESKPEPSPIKESQTIAAQWQTLEHEALNCTLCGLHKSRTHVVFGVGNKEADIMFIGEAPGKNEDLQGKPFVGRAGMLLNAMLQAIGLQREDVYITNILKSRPPNNRDPEPTEVRLCTPYLQRQIALVKPKLLVALGRIAAHFLLNTQESMKRLRGRVYQYEPMQIPLLVTYHPAYLLRSPSEKRKSYIDFLQIKKMAEQD